MAWLGGVARRWPAMTSAVFSAVSIGKFIATERHVWAWLAIGALLALALSLAVELHQTHRSLSTTTAPLRPLLDRALKDGRAVLDITGSGAPTGTIWQEWANETFDMLKEHVGIVEAQRFRWARGDASGLQSMIRAQVGHLAELRSRY